MRCEFTQKRSIHTSHDTDDSSSSSTIFFEAQADKASNVYSKVVVIVIYNENTCVIRPYTKNIVCFEDLCALVQGWTCLHRSARWGRTDIAKYLLDNTRLCEQVDILANVS